MALRHWLGKARRFFQSHLRKGFVASRHEKRRGSCQRCGRCCRLGVNCAFLKQLDDGGSGCSIYEKRPLQCRNYPITPADLDDAGCPGFSFDNEDQ